MCDECHKLEREIRLFRDFVAGISEAKLDVHGADARSALQAIQKRARSAMRSRREK